MTSKFEEWTQTLYKKKKNLNCFRVFLCLFYEKDMVLNGYFSYVATWNVLSFEYWPN